MGWHRRGLLGSPKGEVKGSKRQQGRRNAGSSATGILQPGTQQDELLLESFALQV